MTVRIIVPHRGLAVAKTRLAQVLDDADREALALRLLERVLRVAHDACSDVVVITPSSALDRVVAEAGATLVVQRGMGLNAGTHEIIFRELLKYQRFPSGLFVGSDARMRPLQTIIGARK